MRILISNDDGYLAPGLIALADALASLAEIVVVAPDSNRSGASNSLTLDRPLSIQRASNGYYFINGTPSDCVHIALSGLLPFRPDLMVSGINQGQNMGDDTLYSGTVAAATEGYLFGIPSIAFSQVEHGWTELETAARVAREIVQHHVQPHVQNPLLQSSGQSGQAFLLNVNIPNRPYTELKPWMATRLGKRHQAEPVIKTQDPRGRDIYWIGPPGQARDAGPGTDFHATAQGHVSITPLQIDLTHTANLALLRESLP